MFLKCKQLIQILRSVPCTLASELQTQGKQKPTEKKGTNRKTSLCNPSEYTRGISLPLAEHISPFGLSVCNYFRFSHFWR